MSESKRSRKQQRKTKKQRGGFWPFTSSDGTNKSWFSGLWGSTSTQAPAPAPATVSDTSNKETASDTKLPMTDGNAVGTGASQNNMGDENPNQSFGGGRRKQKKTQKRRKQSNKK